MQVFIPKECLYKKKTDESWWYFKLHYSYHPLPGSVVALKIIDFIPGTRRSSSVQFSSVTQSCLTLCNPMDLSTPVFTVHYQFPELTQTHVHQVSDTIQPSHPLSSPSPPTFNLSQYQGVFQWVSSSHQVAKVLEIQLLISWLQSPFAVVLEPKKIKSITVSIVSPSICHHFKWWNRMSEKCHIQIVSFDLSNGFLGYLTWNALFYWWSNAEINFLMASVFVEIYTRKCLKVC